MTIEDVKSRHRGGGRLDMKETLFLAAQLLPPSHTVRQQLPFTAMDTSP